MKNEFYKLVMGQQFKYGEEDCIRIPTMRFMINGSLYIINCIRLKTNHMFPESFIADCLDDETIVEV
jgi:hypothetical protein